MIKEGDRAIRVLTFNCWGMKWLSKHRETRIKALGERLSTEDYDIICLQELWVHSDYLHLRTKLHHYLPHSHFFFAGFLGSGLAIFSRWPIIGTSMYPFTLNGRPAAVWRGDWYAGKGVATAIIRHHTGTLMEVFTTHFHAPYGKGEDTYMCHRISQAWEIAKLLRGAVERGRFVIATGDFNCYPDSVIHALTTQHGLVSDCWSTVHPPSPPGTTHSMSDLGEIELLGVTCDSRLNGFRPRDLETATDDPNAKRLDYVFTSHATAVQSAQVVLTELIQDHAINYSDHFAVRVILHLPDGPPSKHANLSSAYLPPEIFPAIREITNPYILREEKHSVLRLCHFFLSLAVCIGMHIGVWFVKHKGSVFVMMFFSTMCSWCGVLDGVIGFIWGRWELRGLREFVGEMERARRVYGEEGGMGSIESSG